MGKQVLYNLTEAAAELGTTRATIGGLVKARGLTPKSTDNGLAKGLDESDMAILREALGLTERQAVSA